MLKPGTMVVVRAFFVPPFSSQACYWLAPDSGNHRRDTQTVVFLIIERSYPSNEWYHYQTHKGMLYVHQHAKIIMSVP